MKSALDDEAPIVRMALRAAHGLDGVNNSMRALGVIIGRGLGSRLGATMVLNTCALLYDEIPDFAEDVRAVVEWCFEHPEASSALIAIVEWSERRHPESLALRAREVRKATEYGPRAVEQMAEELKRRMRRGGA